MASIWKEEVLSLFSLTFPTEGACDNIGSSGAAGHREAAARGGRMDQTIRFKLNGKEVRVESPPERMLLWVLRADLGHTGTKYGCGEEIGRAHV